MAGSPVFPSVQINALNAPSVHFGVRQQRSHCIHVLGVAVDVEPRVAAEKIAAESYYAAMELGELARLARDRDAVKASVAEQGGNARSIFDAVTTLSQRALGRSRPIRDVGANYAVLRNLSKDRQDLLGNRRRGGWSCH